MTRRSYYEILGVRTDAGLDEIKAAYRDVARACHPDQNADAGAHERFKAANEAWRVLRDVEMRASYDQFGTVPPGSMYGAALPPRNPVVEFVRSVAISAGRTLRAKRGEDITLDVSLSFVDGAHGCTRVFELPRPEDNRRPNPRIVPRRLAFPFPAGIVDGQILRWRGEGAPGSFGAAPGDLYARVAVRSDAFWHRDGVDVCATIPVPLSTFIDGGDVDVPTLEGPASLHIRAGARPGDVARVVGAGAGEPEGRGDAVFTLALELPPALSDAARAALIAFETAVGPPSGTLAQALDAAMARTRSDSEVR